MGFVSAVVPQPPGDWTLFGAPKPPWERGRPARNCGRRPLERPPAAPGRAGRPRSQGAVRKSVKVSKRQRRARESGNDSFGLGFDGALTAAGLEASGLAAASRQHS